jgi:hypothetical protein
MGNWVGGTSIAGCTVSIVEVVGDTRKLASVLSRVEIIPVDRDGIDNLVVDAVHTCPGVCVALLWGVRNSVIWEGGG